MKLSPLSVPYRIVERGGSALVTAIFLVFSGTTALFDQLTHSRLAIAAAFVGLFAAAFVAYEVTYYRRYEYDLTTTTLDIRWGVFFRRSRDIPLRRVQNVDITRNVVQRSLGIAAVDFETAGDSETEGAIRYLGFEEAKRLQRAIGHRGRDGTRFGSNSATSAPGRSPVPDGVEGRPSTEGDAEATKPFTMSTDELALLGLLSFDLRGPSALLFLASGSTPFLPPVVTSGTRTVPVALGGLTLLALVVCLAWTAGIALSVANYWDFRLAFAPDGLRYKRGLVWRYDGSVPFEKVQTLTVTDNPLKRYFGYASLGIETAGYGPDGRSDRSGRGANVVVPIARRPRVFTLASVIGSFDDAEFDAPTLDDSVFERPPKRVRRRYAVRYLIVLGFVAATYYGAIPYLRGGYPWWLPAVGLPLVAVAAHCKWVNRGYWLGDGVVVTRNGFWNRETKLVPHDRIQTIVDERTLLQRRLHLATVVIDTAGSESISGRHAAAVDVDDAAADELRVELEKRLQSAITRRAPRR